MKIENLSKMIKEIEKFFINGQEIWFEMEFSNFMVLLKIIYFTVIYFFLIDL